MKGITFYEVCKVFDTLESTPSRNEITEILANFYKTLSNDEAEILSYLIMGRVAPPFVKSEFNYSEKSFLSLLQSILDTQNIDENVLGVRKELGDIGDTVQHTSNLLNFKSKKSSLLEIYEIFWELVNTTGTGSIERKNTIIADIFNKLSPLEAKYFSRVVCGFLRLGMSDKTLLDVFSFVIQGDKGVRKDIERAYGSYADIGYICSLSIKGSKRRVLKNLAKVQMQPGIPVLPRLVERVSSFEEVFERLGESVLVQNKYDGLRCQIHKIEEKSKKITLSVWEKYVREERDHTLFNKAEDRSAVRLFTRNLEDVTEMFPEIVKSAMDMKESSLILDSELLGWNIKNKEFLTFQETMQRRRKYDIKHLQERVPVKVVAFDILYLNGEDISLKDTKERVDILRRIDTTGGIIAEDTKEVASLEKLNTVFDNAINQGLEGVIVKQKEGGYLPGTRNYEWIKLKKSMDKKLVDSIDLLFLGYNSGSGRRKNLGIGSILGGIYNEQEDVFEAICNVGTGFTDEILKKIFRSTENLLLEKKPKNVKVEDSLIPDVWVEPKIVFTVEADEITKRKGSNMYSLRFPRLIEWGRDKRADEATTVKEIEEMYKGMRKKG